MELKKERTFGELINDTFSFVMQNFMGIYKPILLIAGPVALISAFFYSKVELWAITGLEYGNTMVNNIGYVVTLILANVLLYAVVYGYVYFYIKEGKDNFTIEHLWLYTKQHMAKIVGALLFTIVFVVIGLLLFIIPGIYLLIPLLFLVSVILYEGLDYQMAFLRCLMLIKGQWWKTFKLVLLVNGVVLIFGLLLKIPEIVYTYLLKTNLQQTFQSLPLQYSIVATVTQFLVFFLQVFPQVLIILLYFNINESNIKKTENLTTV